MYHATLYTPGKPSRTLTAEQAAAFTKDGDLLETKNGVAIWGQANAADYDDAAENPEAQDAIYAFTGLYFESLVGAILLIKEQGSAATKPTLDNVTSRAADAFWAEVAASYPEIKTGDLDPGAAMALEDAMKQAITSWLAANK
jgi:hypothetical protein